MIDRREFDALRAEVGGLRRELRRQRRRGRTLALALVALAALLPAGLGAFTPFNDLVPNSPHNGDIDLIYNAGITTGCARHQAYCPTAYVTREEMASFLARAAGLAPHPVVANAKTAQTATNAQQLGGLPASAYARAGEPSDGQVRVADGGFDEANAPAELDGTYRALARVAITVPRDGFVLVLGTATLMATTYSVARIGAAPINADPYSWHTSAATIGVGGQYTPVSTTVSAVFPVADRLAYIHHKSTPRTGRTDHSAPKLRRFCTVCPAERQRRALTRARLSTGCPQGERRDSRAGTMIGGGGMGIPGRVLVTCHRTGAWFDTGLRLDAADLAAFPAIPRFTARCPRCRGPHVWYPEDARLEEEAGGGGGKDLLLDVRAVRELGEGQGSP